MNIQDQKFIKNEKTWMVKKNYENKEDKKQIKKKIQV